MSFWSAIWGGLALGMFMAISVGPTLFAIIRYSVNHSYKAGLFFVLGVSLSDVLYVTLANFATPLLQKLHKYDLVLTYSAGFLLVILGAYAFFKKYKPKRPSRQIIAVKGGHTFRIMLTGFLMNSLNPALIFQWIAAATGLADERGIIRFVFFATCLGIVLTIDLLKVLLADRIRSKLTLRKIMYLQKFSAFCILLIGIAILFVAIFRIEFNNPVGH